jgi:hypothetical protein
MADTSNAAPAQPKPEAVKLFQDLEQRFSGSGLGSQHWIFCCVAALAGGNDPELCGDLYLHLVARPEHAQPEQRQALVRRIREALVKCICLVGVCKPIEAIISIAQHERDEDKDYTATREGWQCDEANLERGMGWLRKIYSQNTDDTLAIFAAHKDFAWISQNITYGLYLSDRQVLDDLETEIVTLSAIMIQNLPKETHWHIRGIRRIGVSHDDTQVVWDSIQAVAKFLEIKLNRVPTVDQGESDA